MYYTFETHYYNEDHLLRLQLRRQIQTSTSSNDRFLQIEKNTVIGVCKYIFPIEKSSL